MHRIAELTLDWILPTSCLCCSVEGEQLCPECCRHVPKLAVDPPVPAGLDHVCCATLYQPPISEAIQALKYGSALSLGPVLGQLMANLLHLRNGDEGLATDSPYLLVPVPIHRRRQRERGFNQAELLAREVASGHGWELRTGTLVRARYTRPQAELDRAARLANLGDAFRVAEPDAICGRNVLLVDDVLTTGSTLSACAAALREAGAAGVGGLCLAYDQPTSRADR